MCHAQILLSETSVTKIIGIHFIFKKRATRKADVKDRFPFTQRIVEVLLNYKKNTAET
jgi:hypothetical protein